MVSRFKLTDEVQYTTERKLKHDNDEYRVVVNLYIADDDLGYEVIFCNRSNTIKFQTHQEYKVYAIQGGVYSFLTTGWAIANPYFKINNRSLGEVIDELTDNVVSRWLRDTLSP